MKSLSLLVLVAGSVTVLARALPSDYSLDARNALPDADVPAVDARAATTTRAATAAQVTATAHVTVTASKSAAKSKAGKVTASSAVVASTATAKGAGKGGAVHGSACNTTVAASNNTNAALNHTVAASNCTLKASNSTQAASKTTVVAGTASSVTAVAATHTSTASKKTGAKAAGASNAKPTAQPSANSLDSIVEALSGVEIAARDLPGPGAEGEASFSFVDEYKW